MALYTACVCGASDDKLNNFSDTSYESCTAAPDSKSDLRLTTATSCVLVLHVLDICHTFDLWQWNFLLQQISLCLFQMIKKDLKKYSKIFEQKDRLSQSKASKVCPVLFFK